LPQDVIFRFFEAQLATEKQQLSAGSHLAISGRAKLFSDEGSCFAVSYNKQTCTGLKTVAM